MKVILLTDQLIQSNATFIVGGWMQSLINILKESKEIEIAVAGLTLTDSCVEKEEAIYYKIKKQHYNPIERVYRRWKSAIQDEKEIKEYVNAIQDFNPDIIHIFGVESFLCNIIPHTKSKVIVHLQGLMNPILNAWVPSKMSLSLLDCYSFNLFNLFKGLTFKQEYKIFQARAQRESAYFRSIRFVMGRTDWDKAVVMTLGKNVQYFHLEESLRPDFYTDWQWKVKNRKEVQLISVLTPATYKGFDVILKTATLLKSQGIQFQWKICGTYEEDRIVKTMERILKKKYSSNNVSFLGKQTAQELVSLLLDADIFIHPSYIENSPNSVCEAQILGLPIIASYAGGIPSLIQNNETGILFPTNDIYFLCHSIISLLSDPPKMDYLGNNARTIALERHDRNKILKNIESIYNEIIQI
jgi:glycosyltransferase involved in cell wall biosynthesis